MKNTMKMDRRVVRKLTRMGKKMGNGLIGMRMDRKELKEVTKTESVLTHGSSGIH